MSGHLHDTLYEDVREQICRKIYEGVFQEGEKLPAERTLAQMLDVSRITLRKSLELLANQGLIVKEAGSGNRVGLPNRGTPSSTDMIVLIAPAENPFFSEFIRAFQEYGQNHDTMVLYAEKPRRETLADSIYRFYQKHLYNIVIWPEDKEVDKEKLRRLRALGMNMVFFDTDCGIPYGDSVVLDNKRAVGQLNSRIAKRGIRRAGYIGWESGPRYSGSLREQAVREAKGADILVRLPWERRREARNLAYEYLKDISEELPPAMIYADWECGDAVSNALSLLDREDILLAGIDDFPGAREKHAIVCRQDMENTVKEIFHCIQIQNEKPAQWQAEIYCIQGKIVEY